MSRYKIPKPEDFRDRVIDMVKRGMVLKEMNKEFGCTQPRFSEWFRQEFPGQYLKDIKIAYKVRTPRMSRPNNGHKTGKGKYQKEDWIPMTDEQRAITQQRVREAEQDYLPRLAVPVRIMTEEEMKNN